MHKLNRKDAWWITGYGVVQLLYILADYINAGPQAAGKIIMEVIFFLLFFGLVYMLAQFRN